MMDSTHQDWPMHAVYYPTRSWGSLYKMNSMPWDQMTHLFCSFAKPESDGTLVHGDEYVDGQKKIDGLVRKNGSFHFIAQVKATHPSVKCIISVGGSGGSKHFALIAADPELRVKFAKSTADFVEKYSFDGVSIDWEFPETPKQGFEYILLMRELRHQLQADKYALCTSLPIGMWCIGHVDFDALGNVIDHLLVRAFDIAGHWSDVAGNHAQLFGPIFDKETILANKDGLHNSGASAIDHMQKGGMPAHKIILGIPTYGRVFPDCRGPGHPFDPDTKKAGMIWHRDIKSGMIKDAEVNRERVAALIHTSEGDMISLDTPETVAMKADWVYENHLGGMFYWAGHQDRDDDMSLVLAGQNIMIENMREMRTL